MSEVQIDKSINVESSDEEKTFSELLDEYQDQEKMWHFEGDRGLDKLNELTKAIGYRGHGFKYGSSLEEFLSDNPGACEALVEWISENGEHGSVEDDSWRENLISNLNEPEEESEDDQD